MPYGIDQKQGGDSPENDKFMENCVSGIMKKGKDKSTAIAMCKAVLKKHKENMDKKGKEE